MDYEPRRDALFATIAMVGDRKVSHENFMTLLHRNEAYLAGAESAIGSGTAE